MKLINSLRFVGAMYWFSSLRRCRQSGFALGFGVAGFRSKAMLDQAVDDTDEEERLRWRSFLGWRADESVTDNRARVIAND